MHAMRTLTMGIAAILAAVSMQAAATPFTVSIGGERVVMSAIPGLTDALPSGSPRLLELAESLTSASNRILLFALTDADMRRFTLGEQAELKRYMLAVTPGYLEHERVSAAQFKVLIDDAQRDSGVPGDIADYRKYLEDRPQNRISALAQLARTDDTYSVLLGIRVSEGGWLEKPQYLISSNTLMLLRNKALSLSIYSTYDTPQDVEWIRFATGRWIETLRKLNSR